jgi:glycosyltransferase involved in cell wall biosynthesis
MQKLILCKDEATLKCIPKKQRHKCIIFTDVAVVIEKKANNNPKEKQITKFISIGQLEAWRGFDLLIEAFYQATQINKNIQLEIIGDGYYKSHLEKLIEKKQMKNHISLSGRLKIEKYNKKMEECDVVVSPCLKEGAVTAAFDSIAYGKPLICIDTGGFTKYFDNDYAYVIERKRKKK